MVEIKWVQTIPIHAIKLFVTYGTGQNKIIFGLLQPISQVINEEADKESQKTREKCREWILNKNIFEKIIQCFQFYPKIDLFASRLNKQLPVLVSYTPDPEATYVNVFSLEWKIEFYAFPPFSLIGRII